MLLKLTIIASAMSVDDKRTFSARIAAWDETDMSSSPTHICWWESSGLNADIIFGQFLTHLGLYALWPLQQDS